jgi:hypothetical protein
MKIVSLIILVFYLLQPVACFANPCDSCLLAPDSMDTSGKSGSQSQHQDTDDCDFTICCGEHIALESEIAVNYAPLVSLIATPKQHQELPKIVIPIFVPPQNLS